MLRINLHLVRNKKKLLLGAAFLLIMKNSRGYVLQLRDLDLPAFYFYFLAFWKHYT
jgi:hypothetical protein